MDKSTALQIISETREQAAKQDIVAAQRRKTLDARKQKGMGRQQWYDWINDLKTSAVCADCGHDWPPVALGFDHVPERGPKIFAIGASVSRSYEEIKTEIAKCDIVCHSCHAIRTNNRIKAKKPA
jgi:hypothetical protein